MSFHHFVPALIVLAGSLAPLGPQAANPGDLQLEISRLEYQIGIEGDAWQAPNRAQGFRTWFRDGRIEVVPRETGDDSWSWGLELTRYGRGDALQSVSTTLPSIEGDRASYHRSNVVEWFENQPRGLKHGFTLNQRPAGSGTGGQVVLEMAIRGSLQPAPLHGGQAIAFSDGSLQRIHYAELEVIDAAGTVLPSRMEVRRTEDWRLRIVVDDTNAVYPVEVDPLATSAVWSKEGNQDGAQFGYQVVAGDFNGDGFDDLAVGADLYDGGSIDEGRVYTYQGQANGLSGFVNRILEEDQASSFFGRALAACDIDDDGYDDLVVGAPNYDNGQTDEGKVFAYFGSATGLSSFQAAWSVESNQSGSFFGTVVGCGDIGAGPGDDVFVGAPTYDAGQTDEGVAFVYFGASPTPSTTAGWTIESNQVDARLGTAIGLAGDVDGDGYGDLAVGARAYDSPTSNEGLVMVFHGSFFGPGLGGARPIGNPTNMDWGAESDQAGAEMGRFYLGTAGDVNGDGYDDLLVPMRTYDNPGTNEGVVLVYHGSSTGLDANGTRPGGNFVNADWFAQSNQNASRFGRSARTAHDVNGDGYDDIIVGAINFDAGESNEGGAWVYHGSATGLDLNGTRPSGDRNNADWSAQSNSADARFGVSVCSGDMNGDGFSDVAVGAHLYDNENTDEGIAYLYLGGYDLVADEPCLIDRISADLDPSSSLGRSVAISGKRAIMGAPLDNTDGSSAGVVVFRSYDNGQWTSERIESASDAAASRRFGWDVDIDGGYAVVGTNVTSGGGNGAAYVFSGSSFWTEREILSGTGGSQTFGQAVAISGDWIVVGDPGDDALGGDSGSAYFYSRSSSSWIERVQLSGSDVDASDNFGASVSILGDRAIIGAPGKDNGEGAVYVFLRNGLNWTQEAKLKPAGLDASDHFGEAVSIDADRVAIGAPDYTSGGNDRGAVYVYKRTGTTWALEQQLTTSTGASFAEFGQSVEIDGLRLIAGAPGSDACLGDRACGAAFVFRRPGASWIQDRVLVATDAESGDLFGRDVDLTGPIALVGLEVRDSAYAFAFEEDCDGDGFIDMCAMTDPITEDQNDDFVPDVCVDVDGDGQAPAGGDCDETDVTIYTGAPQICDGINNDCGDPTYPSVPGDEADQDFDGYAICTSNVPDFFGDDCDDTNGAIRPGGAQICDSLNNDCDDPQWPAVPNDEFDNDGDGQRGCEGDCNDMDSAVYLGAPESCDGLATDCTPFWPSAPVEELDRDADGFSVCEGDCADLDASVFPGSGQPCPAGWSRTYELSAAEPAWALSDLQPTADSGSIFAGYNLVTDPWVAKLDPAGNPEWAQRLVTAGGSNILREIRQTADGGYVATGYQLGRVWLVRLSSSGSLLWERTYDPLGYGSAVRELANGDFLVIAESSGLTALRISSSGTFLTANSIPDDGTYTFVPWDVKETPAGGYVVVGARFMGTLSVPVVVLVDGAGFMVFSKVIDPPGSGNHGATAVTPTDDGYLVAGWHHSGPLVTTWVLRLDPTGQILWQKTFSDAGTNRPQNIARTSDGNYVLLGVGTANGSSNFNDLWAMKIDVSGNVLWRNYYTDTLTTTTSYFDQLDMSVTELGNGDLLLGATRQDATSIYPWVLRVNSDGQATGCDAVPGNVVVADTSAVSVDGPLPAWPFYTGAASGVTTVSVVPTVIDTCLSCAAVDGDGDGADLCNDCDDTDPTTFYGAPEVNDGADNQCAFDEPGYGLIDELTGEILFANAADKDELSWTSQLGTTNYEVARAETADYSLGCATMPSPTAAMSDASVPSPGNTYFYLVRPYEPFPGDWGVDSAAFLRVVPCEGLP